MNKSLDIKTRKSWVGIATMLRVYQLAEAGLTTINNGERILTQQSMFSIVAQRLSTHQHHKYRKTTHPRHTKIHPPVPINFNTKPTKPTVAWTNPTQFASVETFVNVELDWIERVLGRSHNTKNIDEKEGQPINARNSAKPRSQDTQKSIHLCQSTSTPNLPNQR